MIKKKPFVNYKLDGDRDTNIKTFTLRLSPKDKEWFIPAKKFLQQPKNSTCMKQLAEIGAKIVLQDPKMHTILDIILANKRRNDRMGIAQSEYKV